jgi:uncharacterized protein HemY
MLNEKKHNRVYWSGFTGLCAVMASTQMGFAAGDDLWNKIRSTVEEVYLDITVVSTSILVVVLAVALIMRMVSKNPRSIETWTQWAKNAAVSWVILNCLTYFISFGKDLFSGAPSMPW